MILGFKTGPNNFSEGQRIATDLNASMCELWFNVNKHEEYTEMIQWLHKHTVAIGLHHWGVVDTNTKPNLATQNEYVRNETIRQIRQTIDIGADIGCVYVNIHPGAQALETIDFQTGEQKMTSNPLTPQELAIELLMLAANELHEYAVSKNVLLTIESLPAREKIRDTDQTHAYNPGNMTTLVTEQVGNEGMWIANDITHSGSQFLLQEETLHAAWKSMMEFSQHIAPRTRLVHVNTLIPPFNGTDSHDGITDKDFAQETFPSKEGMKEFLQLFTDRKDVYVVPEPKKNPFENYQALEVLAEGI